MNAYINGVAYYLPERTLDNAQLEKEFPEWSVDKISRKTGIYTRHIAGEDEFSSDMGLVAINDLFDKISIDKNEIDFLLFCTQSPDYLLPTTACILQDRVGLSNSCGALDFNLGCSGYIYGLGLAKGLIESGQSKNLLLVTSETYSKFIHKKDKSNRTIFGDGASATLVTSQPDRKNFTAKIGKPVYGTFGEGYNKLILKNSGIKHKCQTSSDNYDNDGNFLFNDDYLFMDGKEIFNFTSFKVPPLIESVLNRNETYMEDVTMHIFHQANEYMLNFVRQRCNISKDRFYISIEDVGNTVSSTIPIALSRYIDEQKPTHGNKILMSGFGVGLSLGAVIIEVE